jgi:hypothetical protein
MSLKWIAKHMEIGSWSYASNVPRTNKKCKW